MGVSQDMSLKPVMRSLTVISGKYPNIIIIPAYLNVWIPMKTQYICRCPHMKGPVIFIPPASGIRQIS